MKNKKLVSRNASENSDFRFNPELKQAQSNRFEEMLIINSFIEAKRIQALSPEFSTTYCPGLVNSGNKMQECT